MRILLAAIALSAALLVGAAAAVAADFGANDDTAKYEPDGGAAFYRQMADLGLRQIVLPVRFKPSEPLVIQDKELLDRTIPAALDAGLEVVIAVYPYPTRELAAGLATPSLFGSYAGAVASVYPEVKQFVIGNEPNQPAFWRPQFSSKGRILSAPAFGQYLATAYDSLKAVDPAIEVVGVGLSPRGNDRPRARSNVSTSPVRFLRALGAWYRASGRDKPLMDGFSFHPYPNRATDPLDRGYPWPNAGFVNLDRIKQALWDAFAGTPQPTTRNGLALHLDEVGWQVSTEGLPGYVGLENVPVTNELTQAAIYAELVRRASCDPDIAEVSFFGFRDDTARTGFQAALERLDGTARPAAEAVRSAISAAAQGCDSRRVAWRPRAKVLDPEIAVRKAERSAVSVRLRTGEDARGRVCVAGARATSRGPSGASKRACRSVALKGLHPLDVALRPPPQAARSVRVTARLAAEANRARRAVVVRKASLLR